MDHYPTARSSTAILPETKRIRRIDLSQVSTKNTSPFRLVSRGMGGALMPLMKLTLTPHILHSICNDISTGNALWGLLRAREFLEADSALFEALIQKAKLRLRRKPRAIQGIFRRIATGARLNDIPHTLRNHLRHDTTLPFLSIQRNRVLQGLGTRNRQKIEVLRQSTRERLAIRRAPFMSTSRAD